MTTRLVPTIALVLLAAATPAPAQAFDVPAFQAAIEKDQYREAARIVDRLIDLRRPADATLRTDPLLNAMFGQLLMRRTDEVPSARAFLERAVPSELPVALRGDTLLALAQAQAAWGEWNNSDATLDKAAAQSLTPDQTRRVAQLRARNALVLDPARVPAILAPALAASNGAADRWEGEMILGAAHNLLGDTNAATAAADRSWIAAASARARDHAPGTAGLLRAAIAPTRDARIAMLNVAGFSINTIDPWVANVVPVCGGDVRPTDFVTFAAIRSRSAGVSLLAVAASRPAVVRTFQTPLSGRTIFMPGAIGLGGGSLFTVRCRSLVSPAYDVAPPAIDPMTDWLAERGLYARLSASSDVEDVNRGADQLQRLEERYGRSSPRLLPIISNLGQQRIARMAEDGDVNAARLAELRGRFGRIMREAGAPAHLFDSEEDLATRTAIEATDDPVQKAVLARGAFDRLVARAPLTLAYSIVTRGINDSYMPEPDRRRTVETLLARFADSPADLRRRALLVRLAGLQSAAGERSRALENLRAAGALPGACALLDVTPRMGEVPIDTDDYPEDLILHEVTGNIAFEVDTDVFGRAVHPRLIMSNAGGLFDDVTTAKLKLFTFTPGTRRGRAAACIGDPSRVTWKLPEADDAATGFDGLGPDPTPTS